MEIATLGRYLSGDDREEAVVVNGLRKLGEKYAYRLGFQVSDADEIGVDFAAFILTEGIEKLRNYEGNLQAYLRQAARWYVSKHYRTVRKIRVSTADVSEDLWPKFGLISRDTQGVVEDKLVLEDLKNVVSQMSAQDQCIFHSCLLNGFNCSEVADKMGWTSAAARKRLERLKTRLRRYLHSQVYPAQ